MTAIDDEEMQIMTSYQSHQSPYYFIVPFSSLLCVDVDVLCFVSLLCFFVCLFVCLVVCLVVWLFVCLFVCLFVWCFLTSSFGLWMDLHPAGTLLRVDHHLVDEMMKHATWNHYKERLLTAGATHIVHGSL